MRRPAREARQTAAVLSRRLAGADGVRGQDKPGAAAKLRLAIDDQVSNLADPNFPRRKGRVPGTRELVAHENYIVILIEDDATVEVINVVHSRQQYP